MPVTPNSAISAQGIKTAQAIATAAKTTYNDGTNAVLLLTAGQNGGILYSLRALPRGNVTASQLQAYRGDGVTFNYFDSVVMAAYTFTDTSAPVKTDFGYGETNPLRLGANERIYIATRVALAAGIAFDAHYEDL